jgi:hypothetical protein
VQQLMDKGRDHLSPEESALLETMAILIQAHDDRHHPLQQTCSFNSPGRVGTTREVNVDGRCPRSYEKEARQAAGCRASLNTRLPMDEDPLANPLAYSRTFHLPHVRSRDDRNPLLRA